MFPYIIFVLYNIMYIYYFTNGFTKVIEHFSDVLLLFIVNVFHNIFQSFKNIYFVFSGLSLFFCIYFSLYPLCSLCAFVVSNN